MEKKASFLIRAGSFGLGIAFSLSIAVTLASAAEGQLSLLVWEGYADPSFVKDFEAESGCKVQATYVGSNDDFAPKLAAGGGVYDLLSVSADAAEVLARAGFVEAIDTNKVVEWNNIYETFRTQKALNVDGQVWGVPFTWGANPFLYRTDKIS